MSSYPLPQTPGTGTPMSSFPQGDSADNLNLVENIGFERRLCELTPDIVYRIDDWLQHFNHPNLRQD